MSGNGFTVVWVMFVIEVGILVDCVGKRYLIHTHTTHTHTHIHTHTGGQLTLRTWPLV